MFIYFVCLMHVLLLFSKKSFAKWCISQRRLELIAQSWRSTQPTKCLSTNPARHRSLPKEREDTTWNKRVSVVRPSPSSRRRRRPQRRLCWSSSAVSLKQRASESSRDARLSSLERRRRLQALSHSEQVVLKVESPWPSSFGAFTRYLLCF